MTHEEFIHRFESCTLPASDWTHAAHIRMAWYYLSASDFEAGLTRIRNGIRRYNRDVLDKLDAYHETVTVAFARIIASRIKAGGDWNAFVRNNPDLFDGSPVLLDYYSKESLASDSARSSFAMPDISQLP